MAISEEKFTKFSEMSKRMKKQGYKWYCNTVDLDKGLAGWADFRASKML